MRLTEALELGANQHMNGLTSSYRSCTNYMLGLPSPLAGKYYIKQMEKFAKERGVTDLQLFYPHDFSFVVSSRGEPFTDREKRLVEQVIYFGGLQFERLDAKNPVYQLTPNYLRRSLTGISLSIKRIVSQFKTTTPRAGSTETEESGFVCAPSFRCGDRR
jgi:hypothetical protein